MDERRRRPRASSQQQEITKGLTSAAADVKLTTGPQPGGSLLPQTVGNVSFRRRRTLYTTRVDVPAEIERIRKDIDQRFGKGHMNP